MSQPSHLTGQQVNLANVASTSTDHQQVVVRQRAPLSSALGEEHIHTLPHKHTHSSPWKSRCCSVHPRLAGLYLRRQRLVSTELGACRPVRSHASLTLQQLQAGAAAGAHVTDLVFCVPLGTAGGRVAPTWTQTRPLSTDRTNLKRLLGVRFILPMMVTQPFLVTSTTLSIRLFVPLAKLSHSNTPTGPFHTICLALVTASA